MIYHFRLNSNEFKCYIGMTKLKFSRKLKEHKRDIKYNNLNTTLSKLSSISEINQWISTTQELFLDNGIPTK